MATKFTASIMVIMNNMNEKHFIISNRRWFSNQSWNLIVSEIDNSFNDCKNSCNDCKKFSRSIKCFLYLLMILTSSVRCHLSNDHADRNNVRNVLIVKSLKCQNHHTKTTHAVSWLGLVKLRYIDYPFPKLLWF